VVRLARSAEHEPGVVLNHRELRHSVVRHPPEGRHIRWLVLTVAHDRGTRQCRQQARLFAVANARVQVREMRCIETTFARLCPIALLQFLRYVAMGCRHRREFELWQLRRVALSHVRPDDVAPFTHLQRTHTRFVAQACRDLWWRRRHLHAVAVHVEFPAVVHAANAARLVATEEEIRASVWTMRFHDADASLGIPECDEVLTEQPHALRWTVPLGELTRQQDRHPVRAEHLAHRCTWTGHRESTVLFGSEHRKLLKDAPRSWMMALDAQGGPGCRWRRKRG